MKIGLVRHFKVQKSTPEKAISPKEFLVWKDEYDIADIEIGETDLRGVEASLVENDKVKLYCFIPLGLGWLVSGSRFLLDIYSSLEWFFVVGFTAFWFWVGYEISRVNDSIVKGFLWGNWLWALLLMLYVGWYLFSDDGGRVSLIEFLPRVYIFFFQPLAVELINFFSYLKHPEDIILVSYVLMIITFAFGYLSGKLKNH